MKINNVKLTQLEGVANDTKVRLIKAKENFEYKDGTRTTNQLGFTYICLCENNDFEKVSIKVETDNKPVITNEELEKITTPVYINFEGFTGKFWFSSKTSTWELSCKAEKAILVKTK
jgi:spore germination protein GerM